MAGRLGVSPAAVNRWEKGCNNPRTVRLDDIADSLGVSLQIFLGQLPAEMSEAA